MQFKILLLTASVFFLSCSTKKKEEKPNIIYILADDLGYGELGAYGQKIIQTPNIDALARSGKRYTNHYTGSPVCAPSRCVLLTGKHSGHAIIRSNDPWSERGDVTNYRLACENPKLEGQRPIPSGTVTLGRQLQAQGYKTAIIGKWGLGAPGTEGVPTKQGFDYFYGYNCQRQAHVLYPVHLWENETKDPLNNELVTPGTPLEKGADPYDEKSYAKYTQKEYAPDKMLDKALQFIDRNKDEPFFMYYASPLPHLPLQAPKEAVDQYRKIIGEEEPYLGRGYFPCRYPRATYAAMITYLDTQVGEIVAKLKREGLYENTIVVFASDNGPAYGSGVDYRYFKSSGPFSNGYGFTKGFVHEGGLRTPFIASWPGKIEAGSTSEHISAFQDMMPTLCDLAGAKQPNGTDGISMKNDLLGKEQEKHPFLYWEFPSYKGQQAVRLGKWKGMIKKIFKGNLKIELYNIEEDPKEKNNLAEAHPEVVAQIKQIMLDQHTPSKNKHFKFKQLGDK